MRARTLLQPRPSSRSRPRPRGMLRPLRRARPRRQSRRRLHQRLRRIATTIGGEDVDVTSLISTTRPRTRTRTRRARTTSSPSRRPTWSSRTAAATTTSSTRCSMPQNDAVVVINVVELSGSGRDDARRRAGRARDDGARRGRQPRPLEGFNEHVFYSFADDGEARRRRRRRARRARQRGRRHVHREREGLHRPSSHDLETPGRESRRPTTAARASPSPSLCPGYLFDALGLERHAPRPSARRSRRATTSPPAVLNETLELFTSGEVDAARLQRADL